MLAKCNLRGFLPLYELADFIELSQKNIQTSFYFELKQKLLENLKYLQKLCDYALLSNAAYVNLKVGEFDFISNKRLFRALSANIFSKECIKIGKFQPFTAFYFVKRYALVAHKSEIASKTGFKASLFLDKKSKEYILAVAGSDFRIWYFDFKDLWSDFLILNKQIPKAQYFSLLCFYREIKQRFGIEKLSMVGHSLGGYLIQLFADNHPTRVEKIYTFQAPGIAHLKHFQSHKAFHIHTLDSSNLSSFKWIYFHFVQKLHQKSGTNIFLNLKTKLHHPSLCGKFLFQSIKILSKKD